MRRLLALCACARALSPRELVAAHAAKRGAVEFAPRARWAPDVRFSSAAGGFAGELVCLNPDTGAGASARVTLLSGDKTNPAKQGSSSVSEAPFLFSSPRRDVCVVSLRFPRKFQIFRLHPL